MPNNNETTTRFRVDISELKQSMQQARRQISIANSEFRATSSAMDNWQQSTEGVNAKIRQLESVLENQNSILKSLEAQYEAVAAEQGEGSAAAERLRVAINNQRATVNSVERELGNYRERLTEVEAAEAEAARTGRTVEEVLSDVGEEAEDAGDGFTVLKGAVAEFVGNALTALVNTLKDGITNLITFGDEADKALNSFQASTGATAGEMAEFEEVMENIYKANYGESFEDIATAMGEVKRISGDIGADELEDLTTKAIVLRDTFEFEVPESMKASSALMEQFGVTSDEAFNLIAQGAQNGLNRNGDLMDIINEYSVHFQRAGYSAEDMFNMLTNGMESGAWSIDQMGDAVKEFNIRMSDGSAQEAIEALGFSWEGMSSAWAAGGDEAKEVFNVLMNELDGLTNETEGYNIGVGLLGTMFEDLGADAVIALSDTEGEISKTKEALAEINAVKYNTVGEAISGIGRNIQTDLILPISEKLLPIVSDLAVKFSEWLNDPATQEGIKLLTDKVAEFVDNGLQTVKDFIAWFLENKDAVIAGLAAIASGFVAFKVVNFIKGIPALLTAIKVGIMGINTAMKANVIGIIITLVAALVAAFVYLWNNCDSFRQFWLDLWEKIKEFARIAIEEISKFFTETLPKAIAIMIEFLKELPEKVRTWLSKTITKVSEWAGNMKAKAKDAAKGFIDKAVEFIKQLPSKIWTWLVNVVSKVTAWRNNMVNKAKEAASSFINRVIDSVKQLPSKIWTWLTSAASKVTTWGSNLASKGKEAAGKLLDSVVNKVKEIPDKLKSIGSDIVKGLWNGINDMSGWIGSKIKGFGDGVLNGIKDFFGINSPSKVMADEVGKWLPEGMAVGIDQNAKSALSSMRELAVNAVGTARDGLSTAHATINGGQAAAGSGGTTNNFTQIINAPKQPSRLELYRQTKNLLGYTGGGQ